ncbi:MAG TPA: hypothetical protein VL175_05080 [Pirellulales bacterium]|nr:hypothetical protein [Pirellulales bacterium]
MTAKPTRRRRWNFVHKCESRYSAEAPSSVFGQAQVKTSFEPFGAEVLASTGVSSKRDNREKISELLSPVRQCSQFFVVKPTTINQSDGALAGPFFGP